MPHLVSLGAAIAKGFTPKWQTPEGKDVLLTQTGRGSIHLVVVCDDAGKFLYDQFVVVEPIGAATAPIDADGKLGLVKVWRPVCNTESPTDPYQPDWLSVGRYSWEIPRGMPKPGESSSATALREGGEETGRRIVRAQLLGKYSWNSTFAVHNIPLYTAEVAGTGKPPKGDPNEKILQVDWLTPGQVDELVDSGEIFCGFTLAALYHLGRKGIFPRASMVGAGPV